MNAALSARWAMMALSAVTLVGCGGGGGTSGGNAVVPDGFSHRAGELRQRADGCRGPHGRRERRPRRHARRVRGRRRAGRIGQQRPVCGQRRHRRPMPPASTSFARARATRRATFRGGRPRRVHFGGNNTVPSGFTKDESFVIGLELGDRDGAGQRRPAVHRAAGWRAARVQGRPAAGAAVRAVDGRFRGRARADRRRAASEFPDHAACVTCTTRPPLPRPAARTTASAASPRSVTSPTR